MSCYITSGQALGCSDSIGGVKKLYIDGGPGMITGYTYDADGAITGATSTTGTTGTGTGCTATKNRLSIRGFLGALLIWMMRPRGLFLLT
jgi:hypothetical protein